MTVPVAVVGMDFREGPSSLRARLRAVDDAAESPSTRLRRDGHAEGVVRIESCSRVEWVVSASNPRWAGELLRGSLLRGLGLNGERRLHLKVSAGALHYLARVTLGLESVAEGEHAIGRQVIRAFEVAHDAGKTDKVLHMCWHAMGRILQARRATGVGSSVGVQSLAAAALADVGKHELILVKGQGEIGRQVLMTLKRDGYLAVEGFSRSQSARFFELASSASAIVVCTGGPSAWLSLPQRTDSPVVIDLGVPRQLQATPGWHRIELDELLRRRGLQLGPEALAMLEELADEATTGLREALGGTSHHALLEALELEKRKFFESDVEKVLSELAPREARRVSEALRGFTHRLLEVTRRAGRVS